MDAFHTSVTIFRHPFSEDHRNSHALLFQAAERYSGLSASEMGTLETNPWGKPFFSSHPELHFSITHSGSWWLCGFSSAELGLDLQIHRSHAAPETLSSRFFHPLEDAFLLRDAYHRFFDLWCAKESWVKYTGHGFFDDPGSFSVVSSSGSFPSVKGACLQLLPFLEDYSLCLCTPEHSQVCILSL